MICEKTSYVNDLCEYFSRATAKKTAGKAVFFKTRYILSVFRLIGPFFISEECILSNTAEGQRPGYSMENTFCCSGAGNNYCSPPKYSAENALIH